MEGTRRADSVVRMLVAHVLAYPICVAWALGSIPLVVVLVASSTGTTLDDHAVTHLVMMRIAWPAVLSFVLVHAAGVAWARAPEPRAGRARFLVAMSLLAGLPTVVGGAAWLWLMSR